MHTAISAECLVCELKLKTWSSGEGEPVRPKDLLRILWLDYQSQAPLGHESTRFLAFVEIGGGSQSEGLARIPAPRRALMQA